MWTTCCVFTLRVSIALLTAGMFIWLCLIPAVEAAEQTILQKKVFDRLPPGVGRL